MTYHMTPAAKELVALQFGAYRGMAFMGLGRGDYKVVLLGAHPSSEDPYGRIWYVGLSVGKPPNEVGVLLTHELEEPSIDQIKALGARLSDALIFAVNTNDGLKRASFGDEVKVL